MFKWALALKMDKSSDSTSSSSTANLYRVHRRKFFSTIAKWFYTDAAYENGPHVDIADLVIILQALGFKLQRFEKIENNIKTGDLKVQLSCGVSDFEAVLNLPNVPCKCPITGNGCAGEFWEVTGSGPSSIKSSSSNYVNETGSSLLPMVSKGTCSVIRDIMTCLFNLVKTPPDVNQNTEETFPNTDYRFGTITPLTFHLNAFTQKRRHSLESISTAVSLSSELRGAEPLPNKIGPLIKSCLNEPLTFNGHNKSSTSNSNSPKPRPTPHKLIREKTWDLDTKPNTPRPSISPLPHNNMESPILSIRSHSSPLPEPMNCDSPIPQICNDISNISLNYNKETDICLPLREARRNIDKVLRILTVNTSKASGKKIPVLKNSPSRKQFSPRNISNSFQKSNTLNLNSNDKFISSKKHSDKTLQPSVEKIRYHQSALNSQIKTISRPNTVRNTLPRPTITAKRRVSPELKSNGGGSSSASSSVHSGSTSSLLTVGKSVRNSLGYIPRKRVVSSSNIASPQFPRKNI